MRYLELKIKTNKEMLDAVSEALAASGFDEMIISDPADYLEIEEHPEWYKYDYINEELAEKTAEDPEITLYFSDDEEGRTEVSRAEEVLKSLHNTPSSEPKRDESDCDSASPGGLRWTLRETGDDNEWLYKWQEHFKTTKVGERIVVKPSWESYEAEPGELVIEMEPGMAFGSGLHETTSMCIKALEKYTNSCRVLDVGTGTGILAIAAALLGADECLGIDIDADAVRVSRENTERNGLTGRIESAEGDLMDGVDFEPDIIVANLMADLVIRLAPAAAARLKKGGIFISSGILDIKMEIVRGAVRAAGFEIDEVLHDGEWCAIVAKRV